MPKKIDNYETYTDNDIVKVFLITKILQKKGKLKEEDFKNYDIYKHIEDLPIGDKHSK